MIVAALKRRALSSWFRRIKLGIELQVLAARLPGRSHVVPTAGFIAASTGSQPN